MGMHNNKKRPTSAPIKDPNADLAAANKVLEEMIQTYKADTTVENLNKLVDMFSKARVLVPAKLNEKNMPMPMKLKNNDGGEFLPVFTSLEHIPTELRKGAVLNATYLAMNEFAIREGNTDGIVINPMTSNLIFKRALLDKVMEVEQLRKDIAEGKAKVPVKLTEEQYNTYERIRFEHDFLPKRFYEKKTEFLNELIERKEEFIDELYEECYENKRMYPYLTEEFAVTALKVSDSVNVVSVEMPKRALVEKTCHRLYLIEDSSNDKCAYFCIQKESDHDDLVEFKENGERIIHGEAPGEGAELQTMLDIM